MAVQEPPFNQIQALTCSNQHGVFKWLEKMLTHHAAKAGVEIKTSSKCALRQGGCISRSYVHLPGSTYVYLSDLRPRLLATAWDRAKASIRYSVFCYSLYKVWVASLCLASVPS